MWSHFVKTLFLFCCWIYFFPDFVCWNQKSFSSRNLSLVSFSHSSTKKYNSAVELFAQLSKHLHAFVCLLGLLIYVFKKILVNKTKWWVILVLSIGIVGGRLCCSNNLSSWILSFCLSEFESRNLTQTTTKWSTSTSCTCLD